MDTLFKWSVFIISYTGLFYNEFGHAFGKKMNTFYIIKSPAVDIQLLIDIIVRDLIVYHYVQDIGFKAPAIFQIKLEQFIKDGLASFNMQIFNTTGLLNNLFNNGPNNPMNNADMPDNFSILGLIVCCHFISCMGLLLIYISWCISCLISSKNAVTKYFALQILNSVDLLVCRYYNAY